MWWLAPANFPRKTIATDTEPNLNLELEWVPDPARRPGPEEKLVVNKPNTRYCPGPNLGQARELFSWLHWSRDTVVYAGLEKSSKIFWELVKLEPTYITTRRELELNVSFPERLVTQKVELVLALLELKLNLYRICRLVIRKRNGSFKFLPSGFNRGSFWFFFVQNWQKSGGTFKFCPGSTKFSFLLKALWNYCHKIFYLCATYKSFCSKKIDFRDFSFSSEAFKAFLVVQVN